MPVLPFILAVGSWVCSLAYFTPFWMRSFKVRQNIGALWEKGKPDFPGVFSWGILQKRILTEGGFPAILAMLDRLNLSLCCFKRKNSPSLSADSSGPFVQKEVQPWQN